MSNRASLIVSRPQSGHSPQVLLHQDVVTYTYTYARMRAELVLVLVQQHLGETLDKAVFLFYDAIAQHLGGGSLLVMA